MTTALKNSTLMATDNSQQLYARLRHEIESGTLQYGHKLRPIRELTSEWNMSFEGVRQVLNRLEDTGLVSRRQGSGTYISFQSKSEYQKEIISNSVLLLMDTYAHNFRNITDALIGTLQDKDFTCVKYAGDEENPGFVPASVLRAMTGWVKNPPHTVVVRWVDKRLYKTLDSLHAAGTKIIRLFGYPHLLPQWHYIGSNIETQTKMAADWAVSRGHSRIGLITHQRCIANRDPFSLKKRTVGHTQIIITLGHELRKQQEHKRGLTILYNVANHLNAGEPLSPENIALAVKWLSQPDRPTAVVGSDYRLVGIIKAAGIIGLRIPEDLELLGIGNTPWSKAYEFSSIALNEKLIAKNICRIITSKSNKIRKIIVPPDFRLEKH